MPNAETFSALVETATKCFATAFGFPPRPLSNQSRALCALVMVSSVVKVFDEMMKSVSAGSRSRVASTKSIAVHVGDKAEGQAAVAVMLERFVSHHRAEIGAADPDIDRRF